MTGKARRSRTAAPDRMATPRRGSLARETHESAAGAQGPNVGYWQAGGVTRSGAKRSKRP